MSILLINKFDVSQSLRRLRVVISILIYLLIIDRCFAQNTQWTLEKSIAFAKEKNIQIMQAGYDIEIARSNLNTAKSANYPTFNGNINCLYYLGRTVNPYTNIITNNNYDLNNYSLNCNFDLFKGFQRKHNVIMNNLTLQSIQMDVEKIKNDISLNIATVFLELLFYDELIKNDSVQIDEINNQIDRAKEMIKVGVKTDTFLYDLYTQKAQDDLNIVLHRSTYRSNLIDLMQLMELKNPDGFEIGKPNNLDILIQLKPDNFDNYLNSAIASLPQIKSAQYKYQSAINNVKFITGYRYPVFSFETSLNSGYSNVNRLFETNGNSKEISFNNQIKNNLNLNYGFNITIPIFSRFQIRNSINIAKCNSAKEELNVELVQKKVYKEIQKAYYDVISANEKLISSKVLLDASELSFRNIKEKFNIGIISVYDYSTMKTKLTMAVSDYLQAKYEYIFKLEILNFYSGKPITFESL